MLADQARHAAWVDKHAWKYEQMREQQRRQRWGAVARVLRVLTARPAVVDMKASAEQGRLVMEHQA
jgi:hypothetical protein